jgi:hypothetical protein
MEITVNHDEPTTGDQARKPDGRERDAYARPEIVDYGTLTELTLGGAGPQSDTLLSASS